MKVKNIMFSGVMAAILGATAAQADPVQLISKTYADNNLQSKLTAGTGIKIDNGTISADMTAATVGDKTVVQVLESKADASSVETLEQKIGELPTSGDDAATTIIEYIDKKTNGIATDAALGELQDDVDALELKVGDDTVANQIADAIKNKADKATTLSGYGITDAYTKTEVDATVETLATKTELAGYATDDELSAVSAVADAAQTADEVSIAIDDKISALDLANTYDAKGAAEAAKSAANTYADGLNTAMDTRVDALEAIDHTKFAEKTAVEGINTRLQTAEGEIDALQNATANLDDFIDSTEIQAYATTEALAGVNTTAQQGVTDAAAAQTAADAAKAAADEAQADADANATAIEGKVDSIGAGKAGRYFIDFDAEGNATYTQVTII